MFIQTQTTPNPDTVKFLPGRDVSPTAAHEFATEAQAEAGSPLAAALFSLGGVSGVFLGADFIAVTKSADADWAWLKPQVLAAVMDHYVSGDPVLRGGAQSAPDGADEPAYAGEVAEIVAEIKELLETRIRPAVAQDGGDIVFRRFEAETGVVSLVMRGACSGCPSSALTLKQGVENLLRHYVPEVTAVEAVPA